MAQVEEDKLFEGAGLGERARAWGRGRAIFFNDDEQHAALRRGVTR